MGIPLYLGSEAARREAEAFFARADGIPPPKEEEQEQQQQQQESEPGQSQEQSFTSESRTPSSTPQSPSPSVPSIATDNPRAREDALRNSLDDRRVRRPNLHIQQDDQGHRIVSSHDVEVVRRYHDDLRRRLEEYHETRREREGYDPNILDDERTYHYITTNSRGYTLDDLTTDARDESEREELEDARLQDEAIILAAIVVPSISSHGRGRRHRPNRSLNPVRSAQRRAEQNGYRLTRESERFAAQLDPFQREREDFNEVDEGQPAQATYSEAARRGMEGRTPPRWQNGTVVPPITTAPDSSIQSGPPAEVPRVVTRDPRPSTRRRQVSGVSGAGEGEGERSQQQQQPPAPTSYAARVADMHRQRNNLSVRVRRRMLGRVAENADASERNSNDPSGTSAGQSFATELFPPRDEVPSHTASPRRHLFFAVPRRVLYGSRTTAPAPPPGTLSPTRTPSPSPLSLYFAPARRSATSNQIENGSERASSPVTEPRHTYISFTPRHATRDFENIAPTSEEGDRETRAAPTPAPAPLARPRETPASPPLSSTERDARGVSRSVNGRPRRRAPRRIGRAGQAWRNIVMAIIDDIYEDGVLEYSDIAAVVAGIRPQGGRLQAREELQRRLRGDPPLRGQQSPSPVSEGEFGDSGNSPVFTPDLSPRVTPHGPRSTDTVPASYLEDYFNESGSELGEGDASASADDDNDDDEEVWDDESELGGPRPPSWTRLPPPTSHSAIPTNTRSSRDYHAEMRGRRSPAPPPQSQATPTLLESASASNVGNPNNAFSFLQPPRRVVERTSSPPVSDHDDNQRASTATPSPASSSDDEEPPELTPLSIIPQEPQDDPRATHLHQHHHHYHHHHHHQPIAVPDVEARDRAVANIPLEVGDRLHLDYEGPLPEDPNSDINSRFGAPHLPPGVHITVTRTHHPGPLPAPLAAEANAPVPAIPPFRPPPPERPVHPPMTVPPSDTLPNLFPFPITAPFRRPTSGPVLGEVPPGAAPDPLPIPTSAPISTSMPVPPASAAPVPGPDLASTGAPASGTAPVAAPAPPQVQTPTLPPGLFQFYDDEDNDYDPVGDGPH